jgi:hypothetical protein
MKKKASVLLGILFFCSTFSLNNGHCLVIKEKDRTFLVDMTGEKWDISQAVSIGFDPVKFQFGLGKDAIKPLDDSNFGKSTQKVPPDLRILGVNKNNISKAYSIPKLSRHEVANSSIEAVPIAAAY